MTSPTRRTFLQTLTGLFTGTIAGSYATDERKISARHFADRTSLRLLTNPNEYIATEAVQYIETHAHMDTVLDNITYRTDPLHGLYDVSHEPTTVLDRMAGDCVDQGLLAASFIVGVLNRDATIYILRPNVLAGNHTGHVIVDDGTFLYDTDGVHTSDTTVEDLIQNNYIISNTATVSPPEPTTPTQINVDKIDTELTPGTTKDSYDVCSGRESTAARVGNNVCTSDKTESSR